MERNCMKVLIVDDDPLVLMNHSEMLSEAGYTAIPAASVEQGWNTGLGKGFDILVCDHDLGDGKGVDLIRRFAEAGVEAPVIYLSAGGADLLKEASGGLEMIRKSLSKPVSEERLLEALSELAPAPGAKVASRYPRLVEDDERRMLFDGIDSLEEKE